MRVILLQHIKNIGNKGDVKELNDGYVRNFLLPKKLVEIATSLALKKNTEEKALEDKQHEEYVEALKKDAESIKNTRLVFEIKIGEKNEVFGSITERDIERAFHKKGFSHIAIKEKHALKSVGDHMVRVNLGEGITSEFNVILIPQTKRKE